MSPPPATAPHPHRGLDVVGDRHRLIAIGMQAVFSGGVVFAVERLLVTLRTGQATPWWVNALGALLIGGLYLWYRRRPEARSAVAAHGTAAVATAVILAPLVYGMSSTIWWLPLVAFAMILLGRLQEARVWGVAIPVLVVVATVAEPYVRLAGAAGESRPEAALSRIVFAVVVVAMAGGFRAVANRRAAALHQSEETARALINAPTQNAILIDAHGTVLAANARVTESLGTTPELLAGKNLFDQFEPEVGARRRAFADEVLRTGRPVRFEDERLGRWFDSTFFPIFDPHGAVERLAIVATDVTEAKQAEVALREWEKMQAIGQLAGGVAHDFNNLLQAMLGSVTMLRARAADPMAFAEALADVEADVRRGAALTHQLLLFARREVAHVALLDLNDVVGQAASMLRRLVRENIALEVELAGGPLPAEADPGQLNQVLVNLVVNAADAMPAGGAVRLRTGRRGGEVWLEVEDTGHGIPDEILPRIFEPFFTSKGVGKGTGLGLAVVHGIVTSHHGTVEVRSRVGSGTTMRVVLPAAAPVAAAAPAAPAREDAPRGHGERILVVEDEESARKALAEVLTMLGYVVAAAASAEEAGRLPSEPVFDLLLTDLILPGAHGGELARGLRDRWPALEVIVMSGYTDDEAMRDGISAGKVRFLQKPFDMAALAQEVAAALAGRG
jgi:PAS domain S-box-containing protein